MNAAAKFAVVVSLMVVALAVRQAFFSSEIVAVRPTSTSVQGEILSVDALPPEGEARSRLRQAVVKLQTGETIHASVPSGCVVFPGQITRLAKFGDDGSSGAFYMVIAGKDKNDS